MAKVVVGRKYTYEPCVLDLIDGRTNLKKGDVVKVGNLPGCPKANTMGQCYVFDPQTDAFIGMVATASLIPLAK